MISMTTDSVLPRERADFWTDLVSRHVTPMCIEPAGEQPLRGEVQARIIGDLGVAQVCGRGVRATHTRVQIARTSGHLYAACVHLDGEAQISRRGEQIALQKGDVFITDSRQEFALDLEQPWRHLLITLPTSVDRRSRDPARSAFRRSIARPSACPPLGESSGQRLHAFRRSFADCWDTVCATFGRLTGAVAGGSPLRPAHAVGCSACRDLPERLPCDHAQIWRPEPDASSDSAGTEEYRHARWHGFSLPTTRRSCSVYSTNASVKLQDS